MMINNFCPFIKSECREDCVFYDTNLAKCYLLWSADQYGSDLEEIKGTLCDIRKHMNEN